MTFLASSLVAVSLVLAFWAYLGYPLAMIVLGRLLPGRPVRRDEEECSPVTLVISCFDEAAVIHAKLENALALDYPDGALRILVVSDGSTDGTDDIVRTFADRGVRLLRQEGRLGKTSGLNLAMEAVDTPLVVFSDANAMYATDAVRKLVRNFGDADVGVVVGAALYTDGEAGGAAASEGLYWRLELATKEMESRFASVVGGDGAIYAIRAALWEPLEAEDINDLVNPLQIVAKGHRAVFEPEARCYEETAGSFGREAARKERIVNRSIRGLMRVSAVLDPRRTGVFALMVVSHKLLRWLMPVFLLLALFGVAGLAWAGQAPFPALAALGLVFLGLAAAGRWLADRGPLPRWLALPYYFVLTNHHCLRGVVRWARGETQVTWRTARAGDGGRRGPSDFDLLLAGAIALLVFALLG